MGKSGVALLLGLLLPLAPIGAATAQGPAPAQAGTPSPSAAASSGIQVLKGIWVRPDGGYTIAIKSIGPRGELEAMYFNPNPLPFAKAQASEEGGALRVSFELRAGGYEGSTYDLRYDPSSDRLTGTYYQAVARQKFDVYFARQ